MTESTERAGPSLIYHPDTVPRLKSTNSLFLGRNRGDWWSLSQGAVWHVESVLDKSYLLSYCESVVLRENHDDCSTEFRFIAIEIGILTCV